MRAARTPRTRPPVVRSPADVYDLLAADMAHLPTEELHGLYLDRRQRLLHRRQLTRGNDRFTIVDPRMVYRVAVELGAASVIVAHNHPSGDPTPSSADAEVTRRLAEAGALLGVPLLDHVVIAAEGHASLAETGLLERWSSPPVGITGP